MYFGLSSVDTTNELLSVFATTTRIGSVTHGYDWLPCSHFIIEDTEDIVSKAKAKNHYNFTSEFETRRGKMVDQYFGRQNDAMSWPPLDLTPPSTDTTNGTKSPSYLIPVGTKLTKPTPLILPTDWPTLPTDLLGDQDPEPSLSDSSRKYNSLDDTNSNKSNKNKHDKKKNVRKTRKVTCLTHHQATILIRPKIVITDANNVTGRATGKRIQ